MHQIQCPNKYLLTYNSILQDSMLHALCVVQTVSLHKLASAMPTSVERDSNLRRIQRFIANYALNLNLVARVIFSLLPVKDGLVLSMDRTNWNFRFCSVSTDLKMEL